MVHKTERPFDRKKNAPEIAHDTLDVESGTMFGNIVSATVCETERENTAKGRQHGWATACTR
jgi:hypothetical protein